MQRIVRLSGRLQRSVRPVIHWFAAFLQIGHVPLRIVLVRIPAKDILPPTSMLPRAACRTVPSFKQTKPAVRTQTTPRRPAQTRIQHYEICARMHILTLSMTHALRMSTNLLWMEIPRFTSRHVLDDQKNCCWMGTMYPWTVSIEYFPSWWSVIRGSRFRPRYNAEAGTPYPGITCIYAA